MSDNSVSDGSRVVVLGGGPAGAFFALHLLRRAKHLGRAVEVAVLERHREQGRDGEPMGCCPGSGWRGCNYSAGGISPRLSDTLQGLALNLPEEVIQSRIRSITVQGYWKNIELEVPEGRELLSVFRGARPLDRRDRQRHFDAFLLEQAGREGAKVIAGDARRVGYSSTGRPIVTYLQGGNEATLEADFLVLATGVNVAGCGGEHPGGLQPSLSNLMPGYEPPALRPALIFELQADRRLPAHLQNELHFIEYGSRTLRLEMCSLVPKRGYLTVVLVGPSVDTAASAAERRNIILQFLELPQIRKLVPRGTEFRVACVCRPWMVVGTARHPYGERVAAIGDLVTARLYKDGILSAEQTARALADIVMESGVDGRSLARGLEPILRRFRRDNQCARWVFLLHRIVFSSSVLSRVLYQAVITERKTEATNRRRLEKILWRIGSGDDEYEDILRSMMHVVTLRTILIGGLLVTLRNYLAELLFGLHWEGFGRFTTGVPLERLEAKRAAFLNLAASLGISVPSELEFERMYTIKIRASPARILEQLEQFGEADRGYFRPRWVWVHRTEGTPHEPGCVIRYDIAGVYSFSLELEGLVSERLAVYRIRDGFGRGGVLIFEVERQSAELCALSIYVAFNFVRGRRWWMRPFWWLFRWMFPAFLHDVVWNHSLCQFKDIVEAEEPCPAMA